MLRLAVLLATIAVSTSASVVPRQSAPSANSAAFDCNLNSPFGGATNGYPLCCDPTQLTVDAAASSTIGFTEYQAPENACYVLLASMEDINSVEYPSSTGCVYGDYAPVCCTSPDPLYGTGPYATYSPSVVQTVEAVGACYNPFGGIPGVSRRA